jgi:Do/DeqQ family serine protease
MKKILPVLLASLVGGAIAAVVVQSFLKPTTVTIEQQGPSAQLVRVGNSPEGSNIDFTYAAENSVHAVVHVWTERVQEGYTSPYQLFFGNGPTQRRSLSSGSGVIVSNDGFIMTNNHVVDNATSVKIKLNSGKIYDAEVVGVDKSTDLALLKVDGKDLPFLAFGNSDNIKIGQWVLAVGNPFNLTSTVTAGIVSAKARNINLLEYDPNSNQFPIESFIQTDAAVNPGNSGGALVGINGELLGINTAIASQTGSYAGYSFAIPSALVQKVFKDLFEFGKVQRAYIGIQIRDLNEELMNKTGFGSYKGVYVTELTPNGAAEGAGIKNNDIITKVQGNEVNNVTELQENIGRFRPGDKVQLEIWRDKKLSVVSLTLRNGEGTTELKEKTETNYLTALGAEFKDAPQLALNSLKLDGGVQITKIEKGPLQMSGMRPGFIITRVDKVKIDSKEELEKLLAVRLESGVLIEGIYPNGTKAYYGLGM